MDEEYVLGRITFLIVQFVKAATSFLEKYILDINLRSREIIPRRY